MPLMFAVPRQQTLAPSNTYQPLENPPPLLCDQHRPGPGHADREQGPNLGQTLASVASTRDSSTL